ncbi:hypothetical protein M885DRAFT_510738 [Pelagophyceae sp. CCMP2097]|nr:hypothetical protein M885DRAFT_510738 [Pelagophyceae sp. CCMP2097]
MPALRKHCLPYIAANAVQVELVGDACLRRGVKRVVDLGSGDGVVCVSLARRLGIEAVGYELNPWLVAYSRANARWHGVQHLAKFHCKNLFHADVRQADAVVLFVVPAMMTDIAAKLDMEMKDDACVLAGRFPMKPWEPHEHVESSTFTSGYNINQMWVYQTKDRPHFPGPVK